MSIETTKNAVEGYTTAWIGKDLKRARSFLADALDFEGAIDKFSTADELIGAVERLLPAVKKVNRISAVYDDSHGFLLYDIEWNAPMKPLRCAELFDVRDARVQRIRLVFDPTELRAMMGGGS